MNNFQILDCKMRLLLEKVKNKLTDADIKNICESIEYREWGVGYEDLCEQLYEYHASITEEIYSEIAEIGKLMEYDETYWAPLRELIAA